MSASCFLRVWSTVPISSSPQRRWEEDPRPSAAWRVCSERRCMVTMVLPVPRQSHLTWPAQAQRHCPLLSHPAWAPSQEVGGPGAWQPRPLHLYLVPLVRHRSCAFTDGASLPRSMAFPHREEQALSPPVPLPEWESRWPPALAHPGPALPVQQESSPYLGTWGIPVLCLFFFTFNQAGPGFTACPWVGSRCPFINGTWKLSRSGKCCIWYSLRKALCVCCQVPACPCSHVRL